MRDSINGKFHREDGPVFEYKKDDSYYLDHYRPLSFKEEWEIERLK